MPFNLLTLSKALKHEILHHLHNDEADPIRCEHFGESPYDYSTFLSLARAIPSLYPLCLQYMYQWPPGTHPVFKVLQRVVLDKPDLRTLVRGLDLTNDVNRLEKRGAKWPTREQARPLLRYAQASGYPVTKFELEGLYDWVGLAFHLLPNLKAIRLHDGPSGRTQVDTGTNGRDSLIHRIISGQSRYLQNLQHVSLGVDGYDDVPISRFFGDEDNEDERLDICRIISRLLDLPAIKSMHLFDIPYTPDRELRSVRNPEPSTCTHFRFDQSYISRYELSHINERCSPKALIFSPANSDDDNARLKAYEAIGYEELVLELCTSRSFIQHLEELEITDYIEARDSTTPRMRPAGPMAIPFFRQLTFISFPIHILIGQDPNRVWARELIPSSVIDLRLDAYTNLEESHYWKKGDYLLQIYDVIQHIAERFQEMRSLSVSTRTLVSDDYHFKSKDSDDDDDDDHGYQFRHHSILDEKPRLADVWRWVDFFGVTLKDIDSGVALETTVGTCHLVGWDESCRVDISITEDGEVSTVYL